MSYFFFDVSITSLCLIITSYLYFNRSAIPKGLRLPPGPPRKFIIGNLMDLPSGNKPEYITYVQLAKKYGDLVYLNVFGESILLVNSYEMARELFDKRGSIYSDRPLTQMLHYLTQLGNAMLITMPYSERAIRQRAIIHDLISAKKMHQHWNMLEEASKRLLCDLHSDPDNLQAHIRHTLGATVMELLYGIKIRPKNDPFIELAEKTMKCMTPALIPGSYKVDVLPMLKYLPSWFPGLKFPAAAAELDGLYQDMLKRPFAAVEDLYKSGQARSSFVTDYLEKLQVMPPSALEEKEIMQEVATILYVGGIDTTDVALQTFFLAMAIYPEVQKKAQAELDKVIGKDSLPSFSNREDLPYIDAICKEIQRWHAVAPLGLPHRLTQDDVVGEYFIPKGTIVFGNTRALLRSTAEYGPDADKFRPERFVGGKLGYPDVSFGFGRRICPGRYFAEAGIFTTVACTLQVFNISAYDEKSIRDIFENDLFDSGSLSRPRGSYRCKFQVRPGLEKVMQQILIR